MRSADLRGIALVIALAACGGEPTVFGARDPRPEFNAVVSNPVVIAPQGAAASASTSVAYVSLAPNSIPDGRTVAIENLDSGERTAGNVIDGGFDPIAIPAVVDDSIRVTVHLESGGPKEAAFAVPPGRRLLVVRTDPPPGRRDVPLNSNLLVVFSEPVDPASLVDGAILLARGDQDVPVGLALVTGAPWIVRITPVGGLAPSTEYHLTLTTALKGSDGEPLGTESTIRFTTQDAPTPPPPGVPVVAFVSTRDGGEPAGHLAEPWIFLADGNGENVTRLTRGEAPAWSPDGARLAFHRPVGSPENPSWELVVCNRDGSGERVLVAGGFFPSWSPDGTLIVYNTGVGGEGIFTVNVSNPDQRTKLIDYAFLPDGGYGPGWVGFPAFSPDGSTISFVRADYGIPWTLFLMNRDGTNPRELLVSVGDTPPRWSPDGTRLLVMRPSWYVSSIGLDKVESHAYVQGSWTGDPEWSPDGSHILYGRFSGPPTAEWPVGSRMRIYLHPIAGGVSRQFIPEAVNPANPDYWDTQPAWYRGNASSGAGEWDYLRR